MKFFYIVSSEHKQVAFNDDMGNVIFNLNITDTNDVEIDSNKIYVAPTSKMTSIVNSLHHQFGESIRVKLFTDEVACKNSFIKSRIIGEHKVYGDEVSDKLTISDAIDLWNQEEKKSVRLVILGGFCGNFTEAMTSSSVFHAGLNELARGGIQFGADLILDDQKNEGSIIGPHLMPVDNVINFPITLHELNKYDGVFITEEESVLKLNIKESENLHDFFAKVYGVKPVFYKNTFFIDDLEMETMGETIQSLKSNKDGKSIMISNSGFDKNEFESIISRIAQEFPGANFFSFEPIETNSGLKIRSLNGLINNQLSIMGVCVSQMDLVVGEELFLTYLSATFEIPTLILSKKDTVGIKYLYYKSADVLSNADQIASSEEVGKEFFRVSKSIKKLWASIELEAKNNALEHNVDKSNKETKLEKKSKSKAFIFICLVVAAAAAGFVLYSQI